MNGIPRCNRLRPPRNLVLAILWVLLAWQLALAIQQVPARSVLGWLIALLPSTVLGTLLVLVAVISTEGGLIWPLSLTTSGLKRNLVVLPGLFVIGGLLAVTSFLLIETLGYFYAFPIMAALLCLVGVLTLSVGRPWAALALFFAIYPILSYIQVQALYWDQKPASVVFVPVDVIDSSLLDSPLAQLVQMSPAVIFMGTLAGGWLIAVLRERVKLSRTPLDWPIAIFVLSYLASSMLSSDVSVSVPYFVEGVVAPVLLYYVVVHSVRCETHLRLVLLAMLSSGIVSFSYHLHKLAGGADPDLLATSLLFGNTNLAAGLLILLLPVAIVLFAAQEQRPSVQVVAFVVLLACVAELFLSGARGAWIAGIIQITLLLAFSKRVRVYACAFVFPLLGSLAYLARGTMSTVVEDRLGFLGTGEVPINVSARFAIWLGALNLTTKRPLTGIGPGTFRAVGVNYFLRGRWYPTVDAHNLLLSIAAEAGIIAALAFLGLSLIVLRRGIADFRTLERDSGLRHLLFGMLVSIIGYWIAGLTTGAEFAHYHVLAGTPLLWAIMGLIVIGRELQHE